MQAIECSKRKKLRALRKEQHQQHLLPLHHLTVDQKQDSQLIQTSYPHNLTDFALNNSWILNQIVILPPHSSLN